MCFSERAYLGTMILSKKVVIEPTAGVNEAKMCPKIAENCKYSNLQCNNSNIFLYFNIFLCFSEKAYLGTMISSKKRIIELTPGVNEAKICPNIFLCFSEKAYHGYHDFKQRSGHRVNSWNE